MQIFHKPVLLDECLKVLAPDGENQLMVDATLGEGGHSEAFLQTYSDLKIIGLDADASIQSVAKERLKQFESRIEFVNAWSDDFFSTYIFEKKPNRILIDLGISVFHYAASERGFSFLKDEDLDMRLDTSLKRKASDIVNRFNEKELADAIFNLSEERYSRRIAKRIVEARKVSPITKASELASLIEEAVPSNYRHSRLHPATKTFQALRILVNSELDRLPRLLELCFNSLEKNGLLGVITFHSLEDRIVKQYFRSLSKMSIDNGGKAFEQNGKMPIVKKELSFQATLLTKKPIVPSEKEVLENAPSRSAKLRVIKKCF